MAQSSRKAFKEYALMFCGIFVFLIAGSAALYNHLPVLAAVCFVLLGLCFLAAVVFAVLTYSRANAEVDQIVREAKAFNDPKSN